ncbi:MAG: hypothetical protein O3C10_00160 [Chloroflexi bacterium]|nr:hypothetical protein [Chloroflexota bacterium]
MASGSGRATDQELKSILGYTRPGNAQLAGTLQTIGKVATAAGFRYTDVIIKKLADSSEQQSGSKYSFELTAQAKRAIREHGLA